MVQYLRITAEGLLPDVSYLRPYKSVVVVEIAVSPERQAAVSEWLVRSGCLYTMAWGHRCSSWDDSVELANAKNFNYGEIPDSQFVLTTWHEDESLKKVFWFAKNAALHPQAELNKTLILHIADNDKGEAYKELYKNA